MNISLPIYILKSTLRHKFIWFFLFSTLIAVSLSLFLGSSAVIEKDQFTLIFAMSSLRLIAVILLALFVCNYVRQSYDQQEVQYFLARSISRLQLLNAYSLAFISLAIALCLFIGVVMIILPFTIYNMMLWLGSLAVELIIISQCALFFSMSLKSPVSASFSTFGVYVLGRLIGDILNIIQSANEISIMASLEKVMLLISVVTPRFDLLAQSQWLLYEVEQVDIVLIIGQCITLFILFYLATYFDLKRKQF